MRHGIPDGGEEHVEGWKELLSTSRKTRRARAVGSLTPVLSTIFVIMDRLFHSNNGSPADAGRPFRTSSFMSSSVTPFTEQRFASSDGYAICESFLPDVEGPEHVDSLCGVDPGVT